MDGCRRSPRGAAGPDRRDVERIDASVTGVLQVLASVALTAVAVTATWHDFRSRRIPNALVLGGLAAALAVRMMVGVPSLLEGLLGAGIGLALGLVLFAAGAFGGGDGKLLMVVGAFLGPVRFGVALVVIALLGGVLALVEAVRRGVILPALWRTGEAGKYLVSFGRAGSRPRVADAGAISVPYGAAISGGALLTWYLWRLL